MANSKEARLRTAALTAEILSSGRMGQVSSPPLATTSPFDLLNEFQSRPFLALAFKAHPPSASTASIPT